MSKKSYLLVVIGLVVIIVAIYFLISTQNSKKNSAATNTAKTNQDTAKNIKAPIVPPAGTPMPPSTSSAPSEQLAGAVQANQEIPVVEAPIPEGAQLLKVKTNSFEPRKLSSKTNSEITLVLRATDEITHKIVFVDEAFSYINLSFSRITGDKIITFPTPLPGKFNFYIDQENNSGTLIVN